ncbi:MAG TPA: tetratricopeptide repeat protein [Kofleriaceae bacterium]
MRALYLAVVVGCLGGCSAPATLPELVQAEKAADRGDVDAALRSYREAQTGCKRLKPERRQRQACSEALLGEAEVLEHAGRKDEATKTYLAIPPRAPDDDMTAATATYRAGGLLLEAGKDVDAWTALWKVVTDYPDEPIAGDALGKLVDDGRKRDARALADQLGKLLTALAETQVGDNLVWALAELNEKELANQNAARALYDRIPADYPKSGLRDDSRWHAARLSRELGDSKGAAERLRALLATREVALGAGSYFSIWLDNAQLELGKVLRDDLKDLSGAIAAFRKLPKDYPASILKDDALYELATTLAAAGNGKDACRAIADLRKQSPDSKYITDVGALGAELKCP